MNYEENTFPINPRTCGFFSFNPRYEKRETMRNTIDKILRKSIREEYAFIGILFHKINFISRQLKVLPIISCDDSSYTRSIETPLPRRWKTTLLRNRGFTRI